MNPYLANIIDFPVMRASGNVRTAENLLPCLLTRRRIDVILVCNDDNETGLTL